MPKGFHLICAKCGSMDITFKSPIRTPEQEECNEPFSYGTTVCNNCSELTVVGEHNEYIDDWKKGHFVI